MADPGSRVVPALQDAALTALAAWLSYTTSSLVGLQEGYWAAISSIIVMQSEFRLTEISGHDRFIGTAVGALIALPCALYGQDHSWIFALAVGLTIFICQLAKVTGAARLAGVTVAVIVLIPHTESIWRVALFRFLEVSWGIAIALALALFAQWIKKRILAN